MQVYEAKAFLIHENMPVIARRVTLEATDGHSSWRPHLTIFYGGGEAEDGSAGTPACTVSISTVEQLEALRDAVDWALVTHAIGKMTHPAT